MNRHYLWIAAVVLCSAIGQAFAQDQWDYNFGCSGPDGGGNVTSVVMRVVPGSVVGQLENEVLLVAGRFDTVGNGLAVNGLAIWTGFEWKKFPQSNNSDFSGFRDGNGNLAKVNDIIAFGNDVFVCGEFVTANGATASTIAKWSQGSFAWSDASSGLISPIYGGDFTIHQNNLYATALDDDPAFIDPVQKTLRWNGQSAWIWIGRNLSIGFFSTNSSIESIGGKLYVGGAFDLALFSNPPGEHGAVYNALSDSWDLMGSSGNFLNSPYFPAQDIEGYAGQIYYSGASVFYVDEIPSCRGPIERFNGTSFDQIISCNDSASVQDMDEWNGLLVVGASGEIRPPPTTPGHMVKSWNGTIWADMGAGIVSGVNRRVDTVQTFGGHVYVGGRFFKTGDGHSLRNIARFGPFCAADMSGSGDPNDRGRYGVPNGMVDADDFFFFLDLFNAGDLKADIDQDGDVDSDDFFAFLTLFNTPC